MRAESSVVAFSFSMLQKRKSLKASRSLSGVAELFICLGGCKGMWHEMYLKKSWCHGKAFTALFYIHRIEEISCTHPQTHLPPGPCRMLLLLLDNCHAIVLTKLLIYWDHDTKALKYCCCCLLALLMRLLISIPPFVWQYHLGVVLA